MIEAPRLTIILILILIPAACNRSPSVTAQFPAQLRLLSPGLNEAVAQNQLDLGCPHTGYGIRVRFQWEPVKWAKEYHLWVQRTGSPRPWLDMRFPETSYEKKACGSFVVDRNLMGWHWKVEALDAGGQVIGASEIRSFYWAPCRLATGKPCSAQAA